MLSDCPPQARFPKAQTAARERKLRTADTSAARNNEGSIREVMWSSPMNHRKRLLTVGPLLTCLIAGWFFFTGNRYVETENAYVRADKVMIAPEVNGTVATVTVQENQAVEQGQALFTLDTALFDAALAKAEARQARVKTELEALQAAYRASLAQLEVARTRTAFAGKEYRRQVDPAVKRFTSGTAADDSKQSMDVMRQQQAVAEQEIQRLAASLNHQPEAPVSQQPAYLEAAAEVQLARINLEHTQLKAPFQGTVSHLPKTGQHLNAGTPALVLVADKNAWIEANFNETELTHVSPGQTVSARFDMHPDHRWPAKVISISPASGAEFSILPPQNASGNWVKVVQRIPVRIELEPANELPVLRAGMSVLVEVDTGRTRLQRWLQ